MNSFSEWCYLVLDLRMCGAIFARLVALNDFYGVDPFYSNWFHSLLIDGCLNGDRFSVESPRFQNTWQSYPSHTKLFLETYHGRNCYFKGN